MKTIRRSGTQSRHSTASCLYDPDIYSFETPNVRSGSDVQHHPCLHACPSASRNRSCPMQGPYASRRVERAISRYHCGAMGPGLNMRIDLPCLEGAGTEVLEARHV
jgi:hypothetical protein